MQMRYFLSSVSSLVNHKSIAVAYLLLFGDFRGRQEQLAQNGFMLFLCLRYPTEAIFIFGDDEYVRGCDRCDIPEGEHKLVLKDDAGGYLLLDDFVEDGLVTHNDS